MQTCRKCKIEKPMEDFHFHRVNNKHYQTCKCCRLLVQKAWNAKNPQKLNAYNKKWVKANPEKLWAKRHPEENRIRMTKAGREWRERNPNYHLQHYADNKARYVEARARRRASQASATPSWLTAIDKAQIREMYDVALARKIQTGIQHHVDHIIPITGKNVCGMHVPWNLQVITASENLIKGWRI